MHLFSRLNLKWWRFPALLLRPDLAMVGYVLNPAVGAVLYNIVLFLKAPQLQSDCWVLAKEIEI